MEDLDTINVYLVMKISKEIINNVWRDCGDSVALDERLSECQKSISAWKKANPYNSAQKLSCKVRRGAYSATRPDGITRAFYHQFWFEIKQDICAEVQSFFESGFLSPGTNHSNMSYTEAGESSYSQ